MNRADFELRKQAWIIFASEPTNGSNDAASRGKFADALLAEFDKRYPSVTPELKPEPIIRGDPSC